MNNTSSNQDQATIIIPKYWYINNVCGHTKELGNFNWIKLGESTKTGRPEKLVEKYSKYTNIKAQNLSFEQLPHTDKKRLNDKTIHKWLLQSGKFKQVDTIYVRYTLQEDDGSTEFFEPVDKTLTIDEIVKIIKDIVEKIPVRQYSVKNIFDIKIPKDGYHKVSNLLLQKMFEHYPEVYKELYDNVGENYLIIGQPDFDFVASLAMYNQVYIWHDTPENKHIYSFTNINKNIHYINGLKELIEMDIKFKAVLENAPYGKTGAKINNAVRAFVDWEYCISLLPIKDMPLDGLDGCGYVDMQKVKPLPPHTFPDADILTHILVFTKNKIKNYNTFEEVCADSFIVDKPMIKFMRANELKYHYAISNIKGWKATDDVTKTFVFHEFRAKSQHTCGMDRLTSRSVANEYNFNNNEIKTKTPGISGTLEGAYYSIPLDTEIEKQRLANLYKVCRNFINRMIVNQFIAIRDYQACWPKIDLKDDKWDVKNITDESTAITMILQDVANYDDAEVKAVLDSMDKDYEVSNDDDIERLFGEYLNEIK